MDLPSIISVNEAFYPHEGGAEKRSYEIMTRLAKKGFNVKVLTNPFPETKGVEGIDVEYVTKMKEDHYFKEGSRKLMGVLKFARESRKALLQNRDFDIYHFDEFPLYHGIRCNDSIPKRGKSFFTWHEVLKSFYEERGGLWRIVSGWEKRVSRSFQNHIAVSGTVASMLRDTYNVKNVSVIENGVDTKAFESNGKKTWGKVVYVGRIEPHKQIDVLVDKFKGMNDLRLDIIGNGSQIGHLRSRLNGCQNVRIHGHLDFPDLVREVKDSWLFVMPSNREGFSIASLEAMASSVPVLTVDGRYNLAANEIIRDGYNGIVSQDFDDLVSNAKKLYSDEGSWKTLSSNAKDFSKNFDWDVIANRTADLFKKN